MREGRIRDAVRASVPTLTSPLMAGAIDELKKDLDGRSRLDLVQKAAEQTGPTREDFLEQFDIVREVVARGWVAKWLMLLVMAGAALVMAAIHLPRMASALRFPGLALFFSGLLVLALGLVLRYRLLGEPLNREGAGSIPPSLVDIANDVFASMASDIGSGFIAFAAVLAIAGARPGRGGLVHTHDAHPVPEQVGPGVREIKGAARLPPPRSPSTTRRTFTTRLAFGTLNLLPLLLRR